MRVRQDSTSASSPAPHLSSPLHVGCDANVVFDRSAGALLLQVSPRLPAEGHSSHCTADAECGPRRVSFLPNQCCVPVPLLLRLFHQLLAITEPRHRCACGVTPLRARHSCLRSHPDATSSALGVSRTHLSATGTEHLAEHTWQRLMWRLCLRGTSCACSSAAAAPEQQYNVDIAQRVFNCFPVPPHRGDVTVADDDEVRGRRNRLEDAFVVLGKSLTVAQLGGQHRPTDTSA